MSESFKIFENPIAKPISVCYDISRLIENVTDKVSDNGTNIGIWKNQFRVDEPVGGKFSADPPEYCSPANFIPRKPGLMEGKGLSSELISVKAFSKLSSLYGKKEAA